MVKDYSFLICLKRDEFTSILDVIHQTARRCGSKLRENGPTAGRAGSKDTWPRNQVKIPKVRQKARLFLLLHLLRLLKRTQNPGWKEDGRKWYAGENRPNGSASPSKTLVSKSSNTKSADIKSPANQESPKIKPSKLRCLLLRRTSRQLHFQTP